MRRKERHRKFTRSPENTLVLKVKLDKAFTALGNTKILKSANQLVTVSKPVRAKSRRGHIAQHAWMRGCPLLRPKEFCENLHP